MSFGAFRGPPAAAGLLQRSLARGRLGHAYLFSGEPLEQLEELARALAMTVNCASPIQAAADALADACGQCSPCRRIASGNHPDVLWTRPESKSRIVTIDQVRGIIQTLNLKPAEAAYKVAVVVDADRMNEQAANAFLKTLEEPPAQSILILLSTQSDRLLDTIRSRCLKLFLSGGGVLDGAVEAWVGEFARAAAAASGSLLARYRLLGLLLDHLAGLKAGIEKDLKARSPLARFDDLDPKTEERYEAELAAAVESEYRRSRGLILAALECWLRDIWWIAAGAPLEFLRLPQLRHESEQVARQVNRDQSAANIEKIEGTQRLLFTNVAEALALEVGLLRLRL